MRPQLRANIYNHKFIGFGSAFRGYRTYNETITATHMCVYRSKIVRFATRCIAYSDKKPKRKRKNEQSTQVTKFIYLI